MSVAQLVSGLAFNEAIDKAKEALECGCIDKIEDARDALRGVLDEARRKIGLRRWRQFKRVKVLRAKNPPRPKHVQKIFRPWRKGAVHNRHR